MRKLLAVGLIVVLILAAILVVCCGLVATSSPATVTAGATMLEFTVQPVGAKAMSAFATQPVVTIEDAFGNIVTSSTATVTVDINSTGTPGAVLYGETTVKAVNGVATFTSLSIDLAGSYYTLTATSDGLSSASSEMFNILAQPS